MTAEIQGFYTNLQRPKTSNSESFCGGRNYDYGRLIYGRM